MVVNIHKINQDAHKLTPTKLFIIVLDAPSTNLLCSFQFFASIFIFIRLKKIPFLATNIILIFHMTYFVSQV